VLPLLSSVHYRDRLFYRSLLWHSFNPGDGILSGEVRGFRFVMSLNLAKLDIDLAEHLPFPRRFRASSYAASVCDPLAPLIASSHSMQSTL
jgi:hypothetical protein